MSFAAVLLAPFVLLFPDAGAVEVRAVPEAALGENAVRQGEAATPAEGRAWVFRDVVESFRVRAQNQVRVEQHMAIRITPQSRPQTMPQFLLNMPGREVGPRLVERSMGRCVSIASISGMQPDTGGRLILFLRDRRMVSAVLERACRARDFYSGFYVERNSDGRLCVDRDTLLSRSGANCKLTRIRQLVDPDD